MIVTIRSNLCFQYTLTVCSLEEYNYKRKIDFSFILQIAF